MIALAGPFYKNVNKSLLLINYMSKVKTALPYIKFKKKRIAISWLKRSMDLLFCLASLPLALPLGLILGLYIKMDSRGSVIYRQERIGREGKRFIIYKFRTMIENADMILEKHLADSPELAREWRDNQKLKADPRLTRAGRFLRKTSLDELPQLLNIMIGNMSFVGPRPIVEEEKARYGSHFDEYCGVLPGLTGLWQVSGRNNTSYEERVEYDMQYINNWSLKLDLWIIVRTIPQIIKSYGAY